MKKALHIITGLDQGGAEAVLYRLCANDRAVEHQIISLTDEGHYGPRLREFGIGVQSLAMVSGRLELSKLITLVQQLKAFKPDVVQTWMYHANLVGGIAARLSGQRNLCWGIRQTSLSASAASSSAMISDRICARISKVVPKTIVCCAERARQSHLAKGYARDRMTVIKNGYELDRFKPDAAAHVKVRSDFGLSIDELVVGFVARYHPFKDHENLLKALAILRESDIRPICLLAGEGMEESNDELAQIISAMGLESQIKLLGSRADVPDIMNAIDIHVMSSLTEGFPNVLAEAMACGTPCLSTDVGDAADIIGETGMVVAPRNPSALAIALEALLRLRDGDGWPTMQASARRRIVSSFSLEQMIQSYHIAWFGARQ